MNDVLDSWVNDLRVGRPTLSALLGTAVLLQGGGAIASPINPADTPEGAQFASAAAQPEPQRPTLQSAPASLQAAGRPVRLQPEFSGNDSFEVVAASPTTADVILPTVPLTSSVSLSSTLIASTPLASGDASWNAASSDAAESRGVPPRSAKGTDRDWENGVETSKIETERYLLLVLIAWFGATAPGVMQRFWLAQQALAYGRMSRYDGHSQELRGRNRNRQKRQERTPAGSRSRTAVSTGPHRTTPLYYPESSTFSSTPNQPKVSFGGGKRRATPGLRFTKPRDRARGVEVFPQPIRPPANAESTPPVLVQRARVEIEVESAPPRHCRPVLQPA